MGNGAKAQMKRAKNDKAANGSGSQLKTNTAAQTIQCFVCKNTFQMTAKKPELTSHADSKHNKTFEVCFPGITM